MHFKCNTKYNLPFVIKEDSLLPEERRQLSKIFPLSFCNSDYIEAPAGKDETQKSSVSKLYN